MTGIMPPPSIPDLILFMENYLALSILILMLTAAIVGKVTQQTGRVSHGLLLGGTALAVFTFLFSNVLTLLLPLQLVAILLYFGGIVGLVGDK